MYKRRIKIFLALVAAVMLLLALRIGHLQMVEGARYRAEFERSMREVQLLPAARGQITDRMGKILAADLPCQDFCLDYRFLTNDPNWAARQRRLIQREAHCSALEAAETFQARQEYTWQVARALAQEADADLGQAVKRILDSVSRIREGVRRRGGELVRIREEQQSHPVVLALSDESARGVESDIREGRTVGAVLRPGHKRFYPYGEIACHVIGMTGTVTQQDLERENIFPLDTDWVTAKRDGYEPDDSIGISGLEMARESSMRGHRGYRVLDVGSGTPEEVEGEPARSGEDVHTTLDLRLQEPLAERLRQTGHNGAAVVISIAQGEIIAMASVPTYDLNRYGEESARLAADNVDYPLLNRAVGGRYPPGSSIKPAVALAALTAGKITAETRFTCEGCLDPKKPWELQCTASHGSLNLHEAIMRSCNVYFFHVGERLGLGLLDDWFRMFGLHERVGTGLPEEKPGHVPSPEWIADPVNHRALDAEAIQEGIGQGLLLVTPLHMANLMATIARDGRVMEPMLVLEGQGQRSIRDLPIRPGAFAAVRGGMKSVTGTPGGTGYAAFQAEPLGFEVCGKSGTAQISRDGIKMVWFEGFAPADKPKIAFAVLLERLRVGSGGKDAAPVARDLLRWCKELGYLND